MRLQNIILLKAGKNTQKNIFFLHAGNGEIANYIGLASLMPVDVYCWGVRLAYNGYSPFNMTIEKLSETYLQQIRTIQPEGSYLLVGWCYGGMRAYEIAHQIKKSGNEVKLLGLINTTPPIKSQDKVISMIENYSLLNNCHDYMEKFSCESETRLIKRWLAKLSIKWEKEYSFDSIWTKFIEEFENTELEKRLINVISDDLPKDRKEAIPSFSNIRLRKLIYYLSVLRSDANMQILYNPTYLCDTKISYFYATEESVENKNNWNKYVDEIDFISIKGNHFSIFEDSNVKTLAEEIKKCMEE